MLQKKCNTYILNKLIERLIFMIKKTRGSKRLRENAGNEFGYLEYTQYFN